MPLRNRLSRAIAPIRGGHAALCCSLVAQLPRAQILLQHLPLQCCHTAALCAYRTFTIFKAFQ